MDIQKFNVFSTGMTEEELAAEAQAKEAKKKMEQEYNEVKKTARSKGFQIIMNQLFAQREYMKEKLCRAKRKKTVLRLQAEIKAIKLHIDLFTPYLSD